jgi:hypothetical protein
MALFAELKVHNLLKMYIYKSIWQNLVTFNSHVIYISKIVRAFCMHAMYNSVTSFSSSHCTNKYVLIWPVGVAQWQNNGISTQDQGFECSLSHSQW